MNLLCRIGLHSWKPVCRLLFAAGPFVPQPSGWLHPHQTGLKCRRCHKRVELP